MPPLWRKGEQPCNTWAHLPLEQRASPATCSSEQHHTQGPGHSQNISLSLLASTIRMLSTLTATTVVSLKKEKLLFWNATCPNTFPSSYSSSTTRKAGAVAALTEERKMARYAHLNPLHAFTQVAIETCSSQPLACLHSSGNRDIWSLWSMNHGIPEGVGSAVGASFWG